MAQGLNGIAAAHDGCFASLALHLRGAGYIFKMELTAGCAVSFDSDSAGTCIAGLLRS
jgi:hypothetical protein